MAGKPDVPNSVRLVVADVAGTLVTPDKILTPRARAVVRTMIETGIAFTITSGRPPLGMKTLIDELGLRDPIAAFNGGLVVRPDLSIIREHLVTNNVAQSVIDIVTGHDLDVWVYGDNHWYVTTRHGPHVDREEWTVRFPPTVVPRYDGLLDRVVKIVGVSDDDQAMSRCVTDVQRQFGHLVTAALSQPYYLDVTHPKANKGEVVTALSALLAIPAAEIVTIDAASRAYEVAYVGFFASAMVAIAVTAWWQAGVGVWFTAAIVGGALAVLWARQSGHAYVCRMFGPYRSELAACLRDLDRL